MFNGDLSQQFDSYFVPLLAQEQESYNISTKNSLQHQQQLLQPERPSRGLAGLMSPTAAAANRRRSRSVTPPPRSLSSSTAAAAGTAGAAARLPTKRLSVGVRLAIAALMSPLPSKRTSAVELEQLLLSFSTSVTTTTAAAAAVSNYDTEYTASAAVPVYEFTTGTTGGSFINTTTPQQSLTPP